MKARAVDTVKKSELKRVIDDELREAFINGQRIQRDIDILAINRVFNAGVTRIERFNNMVNELVMEYNVVFGCDGMADERLKQALAQIGIIYND